MKAHPPVMASRRKTSTMNLMRRDPMRTCLHALTGMLGIPLGHLPDLTGGGAPRVAGQPSKTHKGGPLPPRTQVLIGCGPSTMPGRPRRLNRLFPFASTCLLRAQRSDGPAGKHDVPTDHAGLLGGEILSKNVQTLVLGCGDGRSLLPDHAVKIDRLHG